MTHDSFAVSEDVVRQFEQENNATVEFLKAGDAGEALNKACLSKDNPLADVFFGVDNTFFSRAIDCGIFQPYRSLSLANVETDLQIDPAGRLLPVDYGYVTLNYWRRHADRRPTALVLACTKAENDSEAARRGRDDTIARLASEQSLAPYAERMRPA